MLLIVFMKKMAPAVNPPVSFPVSQLQDFPVDKGKTLFVVSNNIASVDAVMRHVAANLSTTYQLFETEDSALKAYFMKRSEVSAGIIFGYQSKEIIFSYAIRMPGDQIASTQDRFMMNTGFCRHGNPNGTSTAGGCQANTYLQTGFAYLQYVIDQALLQLLNVTAPLQVTIQIMPKEKYTPPLGSSQSTSSIIFVLGYSIFNYLTVTLVAEKEKKIKDGMLMMGLQNSVLTLSWTLVYLAEILVVTSVVTIIAALGKFLENSNMFFLWLIIMLYGFSIIAMAILMSSVFQKAQTAGAVISFITFVITLLFMAATITKKVADYGYFDQVSFADRWAMCLIYHLAFSLAIDTGIFLDRRRGGITLDNMTMGDFPLLAPVVMLGVDTVLYYLLSVYLDHVISGEYKLCYFLDKSYWFPRQRNREEAVQVAVMTFDDVSGPNFEPVSADMRSKCQLRSADKLFKLICP